MASGLAWKRNRDEVLERLTRFLRREMQDGILAVLPVTADVEDQWEAFEARWGRFREGDERPFPSNEEIFERFLIGLPERADAEDDCLPVVYSTLDGGDDLPKGLFGQTMRFFHRPRAAAYSGADPPLEDCDALDRFRFSPESPWARRMLAIQDYFERNVELEFMLQQKGESELLEEVRRIATLANISFVRQEEPLGLGHAILATRELVGDEPFAIR